MILHQPQLLKMKVSDHSRYNSGQEAVVPDKCEL